MNEDDFSGDDFLAQMKNGAGLYRSFWRERRAPKIPAPRQND
jgi:hypothetical protein